MRDSDSGRHARQKGRTRPSTIVVDEYNFCAVVDDHLPWDGEQYRGTTGKADRKRYTFHPTPITQSKTQVVSKCAEYKCGVYAPRSIPASRKKDAQIDASERHRTSAAEKKYLRQMEEYEHQRDLYRQQVNDAQAHRYEQYFERMMEYGAKVQAERYRTLLRRQEMEREAMAKNLKQYGLHPSDIAAQTTEESTRDVEAKPVSPFGNLRPLPNAKQKLKQGTSHVEDCQSFLPRSDPLYSIAHAFSSNVGLNLGTAEANGIPYYPINEEGSISLGRTLNVPFGSWGGGFTDHFGVRDYWSQTSEVGANWYDGKYGRRFLWSVPLVQSLGVEGDVHDFVSVPIKPGELGKPIAVDIGLGVGPYYQQNQHVGVDWLNGQVGTTFGLGVPFAGVGYKTGSGVVFPSVSTFAGYL